MITQKVLHLGRPLTTGSLLGLDPRLVLRGSAYIVIFLQPLMGKAAILAASFEQHDHLQVWW
ncbi:hypothetical protein SLEP1_g38666 [Rubroshorea leprosula]|uniref:Uncharacterized protein n=1 Tax=Rubroshorea leprosula TaxID=152421 RepID=A0AAV5KXS3_9ROSI|nr:hypothetical protein SLEP1_g38666 [Rubroshorea leprosula]